MFYLGQFYFKSVQHIKYGRMNNLAVEQGLRICQVEFFHVVK